MNLPRRIARTLLAPFRSRTAAPPLALPFQASTAGVPRRDYASYEDYLAHQAAKLSAKPEAIAQVDAEYEGVVRERYATAADWKRARVLCLAARLGAEVRAMKSFGALAVGIDIAPGPNNPHVLYGDFHALAFPDGLFDVLFCNAVDHVYDLPRFLAEARRVLAPGGVFLIELMQEKPGEYEAIDTRDTSKLLAVVSQFFAVESDEPAHNKAGYVKWNARLLRLRKR